LHWLEGLLLNSVRNNGIKYDETKSVARQWDMKNPDARAAFWAREQGSNSLLMPVTLNPASAASWFQFQQGKSWDYNFFANNCANYAVLGLNAGGAGLNFLGPHPTMPGTYTMSWSGGASPTPLTAPITYGVPNPVHVVK
jgi:hypothetical protein